MHHFRIRILFGSIRSKGVFNNNPTVLHTYRRLAIDGEIKLFKGGFDQRRVTFYSRVKYQLLASKQILHSTKPETKITSLSQE